MERVVRFNGPWFPRRIYSSNYWIDDPIRYKKGWTWFCYRSGISHVFLQNRIFVISKGCHSFKQTQDWTFRKLCWLWEFHFSSTLSLSKMIVESCSQCSAPGWYTILILLFTVYRYVSKLFHPLNGVNVVFLVGKWCLEFVQRCFGNANSVLVEEGGWSAEWEGKS